MEEYTQGADEPDMAITWLSESGSLINFSTGWSFVAKVGTPTSTRFTKSSGFTGAATAPNLTITWLTSGELNSIPAGTYMCQVTATRTSGGQNRIIDFRIRVKAALA